MALDLRRSGVGYRVQWSHPALAKIMRLYLPIAAGLLVAQAQIILDRRLASGTGAQSIAWMRSATTLQQMPLGLISVAIALAALPKLSQHFAVQDEAAYRHTLGRGLRMVLVLMIPAAVGLWLLGEPVTRLFFQRGLFTAQDTAQVVGALNIYLVGMLFAAVDFPLNYAFYARNNTLWPALVGVVSVGVYAVVALALVEGAGYLGAGVGRFGQTGQPRPDHVGAVGVEDWPLGGAHGPRVGADRRGDGHHGGGDLGAGLGGEAHAARRFFGRSAVAALGRRRRGGDLWPDPVGAGDARGPGDPGGCGAAVGAVIVEMQDPSSAKIEGLEGKEYNQGTCPLAPVSVKRI